MAILHERLGGTVVSVSERGDNGISAMLMFPDVDVTTGAVLGESYYGEASAGVAEILWLAHELRWAAGRLEYAVASHFTEDWRPSEEEEPAA